MTPYKRAGKIHYRSRCLDCERKRKREWAKNNKIQILAQQRRKRAEDPAWAAWRDSKYRDAKLDLTHNLSREAVAEIVAKPCCYCGEIKLRMTMDRIDNTLGHIQGNVVPACIRCNYTRKNMPYEAWIVVAQAMKYARAKGLFGKWTGRARSPNKSTLAH